MYTEITTVEEVFKRHPANIDLQKVEEALSFLPKEFSIGMISLMKAQAMSDVLNNDEPTEPAFDPDYNNPKQDKWGSWWLGGDSSGAGFRFYDVGWTCTTSAAGGGARLALKDRSRGRHAKEHFPELYKGLYLKLKQ